MGSIRREGDNKFFFTFHTKSYWKWGMEGEVGSSYIVPFLDEGWREIPITLGKEQEMGF